MSLALSFPGIYIQEIPLSTQTITPAPTSITAFVGYSHPYRTLQFNTAVQLFSFTDYEKAFGGLFTSGLVDPHLARAVFQFFLNGGTNAWVVGLQAKAVDVSGNALGIFGSAANSPTVTPSELLQYQAQVFAVDSSGNTPSTQLGIQFTANELCDTVQMTVTIANVRQASVGGPFNTFDVVITYGTQVETYRGLVIGGAVSLQPDNAINPVSRLVTVSAIGSNPSPSNGNGFGTALGGPSSTAFVPNTTLGDVLAPGSNFSTTFSPADYTNEFTVNSSLDKVEIFNLLLIPGVADNLVVSAALSFAERKRAFAILDPPMNAVADNLADPVAIPIVAYVQGFPKSQNGALYFPYLITTDPVTDTTTSEPPSGFVAGIYSQTDATRGVWKAPAGIAATLLNTAGPVATGLMNDPQQGVLNVDAINAIRSFAAIGTVVFGARTLVGADANTGFPQSKFVPVRRMTLFIEQTLVSNLKWVVFEPNAEPLWIAIRLSISAFLLSLFNQGALQGSTPSQAFQVKVDSTTTTPEDQQNGIVNIVVAFAPLKPAEFVVIKISQLAGQSTGA
jgi:phage tail sheath protein FI